MLNRGNGPVYPCLKPDFSGNTSNILPLSRIFAVGFFFFHNYYLTVYKFQSGKISPLLLIHRSFFQRIYIFIILNLSIHEESIALHLSRSLLMFFQ